MRILLSVIILIISTKIAAFTAFELGKEEVISVRFPKFSIAGLYNIKRQFHGFADSKLRFSLGHEIAGILAFEAGLYKYFNAGAQLSFGIPRDFSEPVHLGLGLFMKPFWAFNKRCSFFSRIGGGLSGGQGGLKRWLHDAHTEESRLAIERVYGESMYYNTAFGGNIHASIGFEYFLWPLFGLALEGGVRAEIWRERGVNVKDNTPANFDYITYEFPLGLIMHIIL